jgi:hypothetical protein
MAGKHFSNTGQILQLIVAVIGVVIAGRNAYTSIEARELLAVWPIVFYLFVLIVAIVLVLPLRSASTISTDSSSKMTADEKPSATVDARSLPTVDAKSLPISRISEFSDRMPDGAIRIDAEAGTFCFKMKPGDRRTIGTNLDKQTLELHGFAQLPDGETAADISVSSFLDFTQGGRRVKEKTPRRFLVPRISGNQTDCSLFSAVGSKDHLDIDLIGIDHINEHTGEVDLTIIRCWGRVRGKGTML